MTKERTRDMSESRENGLRVEQPCPMRWAELEGGGNKRFCGQCSLHVVDGSAMTKDAAEHLVRSSDERVCMRLALDGEGRPLHAKPGPAERQVARLLRYGLTAAAGVLSACGDQQTEPNPGPPPATPNGGPEEIEMLGEVVAVPERPIEIMGDVCYPEPDEENEPEATEPDPEIMGKMIVGPAETPAPENEPD